MNNVYEPVKGFDPCNQAKVAASDLLKDLRHKLFRGGRLTKVDGITGSIAPEASQLGGGLLLALGVSLAGLGFSSSAEAGSCALTLPGSLLCSGPVAPATDTQQYYDLAVPITATTTGDFGIQSKAGQALDMRGVGGVSFTQTGTGVIAGADVGIYLQNRTSGNISLTASGDISGSGRYGIQFSNGSGTGDTTIQVNNVQGETYGIYGQTAGTGTLSIVSTGTITTNTTQGIEVENNNAANTGTSIEVNQINAGGGGIIVQDLGSGTTSVVAHGTVTAANGRGIAVVTGGNSAGVQITAEQSITASNHAIQVTGGGTGDVIIQANNLTSTGGRGVWVESGANTNNVSINVGAIDSGGDRGIYAVANGSGAMSVVVAGDVTSSDTAINLGMGANTQGGLSVTTQGAVTATNHGIWVTDSGQGGSSITALGTITATNGNGISASNTANGKDITINAADINAGSHGVYVSASRGSGGLNIATGNIVAGGVGVYTDHVGTGTDGTTVSVGSLTTGSDGVNVQDWSKGSISVTTNGVVDAKGHGIFADNTSSGDSVIITANDTIKAGNVGIYAISDGQGGLNIKAQDITSGGIGVWTDNTNAASTGGTTIDVGAITSGGDGINAQDWSAGNIAIATRGAVTAGGIGIFADNTPTGKNVIVNVKADVTGGSTGIYVLGEGSGGTDITAEAAVAGKGGDGIYVSTGNTSTHLNVTAKDVTGTRNGITTIQHSDVGTPNNDATINVSGVIQGGSGYGIWTESDGGVMTNINIADTATVRATSGNAVFNDDGDSTITVAKGAKVYGAFSLGAGSDSLTFNGTDLSNITTLDGGDDKSSADGWIDRLTLNNINQTVAANKFINWEVITLNQSYLSTSGTLDAENVFVKNGSTLDGMTGLALTGNLSIDPTSRFVGAGGGKGVYSVTGNLHNDGVVTLRDGAAGDRLTVQGNYSGSGKVQLDANFATGAADVFAVNGNITTANGATNVEVTDVSPGSLANGQPVTVVSATGDVDAGALRLAAPITRGVWDYSLQQFGHNALLVGRINPIGAAYEAAPSILLNAFTTLPTLEQRVGQRQWISRNETGGSQIEGLWFRVSGDREKLEPGTSRSSYSSKANTTSYQAGVDLVTGRSDSGYWVVGATGQYGRLNSTITNPLGKSKVSGSGYGAGLTASWHGAQGFYVDSQLQVNRISTDMSADAYGPLINGQHRTAVSAGVEVGQHFDIADSKHWLVPQAQLSYGRIGGSKFTDMRANNVDFGSADQLIGRVGVAYQYRPNGQLSATNGTDGKMVYVIANLLHDFSSANGVSVGTTELAAKGRRTWAELGVGGSLQIGKSSMLYGEAAYRTAVGGGASGNKGLSANVGVRVSW